METEDLAVMDPQGANPSLDDETHEVEHEGRVYRIPNALRGAFLMNADYTRKTQELADHRRALEQDRSDLDARRETIQASLDLRVALHAADEQLAAFEDVDWDSFAHQDPHGAQALWAKHQALAHTRERYVWAITHHEEQARRQAEQDLAAQMTETGRVLSREIEGWSPQVAAKLVEYAAAFGVTLEELREIADPRLWKILHRAHQGEQMQQQQATARNVAQAQAVRPAVSVTGAAAPTGSVRDDLGTGEWIRRRNEQTRKVR